MTAALNDYERERRADARAERADARKEQVKQYQEGLQEHAKDRKEFFNDAPAFGSPEHQAQTQKNLRECAANMRAMFAKKP
ncbi:MAG: hypothetical protein ABSG41_26635 [Bryobacteraceae bacterium]|jgi:hypothetical protein